MNNVAQEVCDQCCGTGCDGHSDDPSRQCFKCKGTGGIPKTTKTPTEVIQWIAEVAAAIGWQAGVGATETAGGIVSVLAANPHLIERFLTEGSGLFIDGPVNLDVVNGCLTYYAQTGEVLSPGELHRRRGKTVQ